jgi:hypothetical protein
MPKIILATKCSVGYEIVKMAKMSMKANPAITTT